jgi:hypothetical protein
MRSNLLWQICFDFLRSSYCWNCPCRNDVSILADRAVPVKRKAARGSVFIWLAARCKNLNWLFVDAHCEL